jgi:hypothetical protein
MARAAFCRAFRKPGRRIAAAIAGAFAASPGRIFHARTALELLDTATGLFSLSPPAERGERVGERATNAVADKDSGWLEM